MARTPTRSRCSVGLRSSVAAASLRRLVGSAQSHIEITRLRSTPTGRGGASGYAPAAIFSVQSANAFRCSPSPLKTSLMLAPLGPIAVWRSHASSVEASASPWEFARRLGADLMA